jgi:hypothetical protein
MAKGDSPRLFEVLSEARVLIARPDNDFTWSSWRDAEHALGEIDRGLERLRRDEVAILFAPTGPMQELALSSGWGEEFAALADRFDEVAPIAAQFLCSICGEPAGVVALEEQTLRRQSFTGALTQPLGASTLASLRRALKAGDPQALFALDPEFAPFYCPDCGACYCAAHWATWDVFDDDMEAWRDSIRGRCPHGHERMLED